MSNMKSLGLGALLDVGARLMVDGLDRRFGFGRCRRSFVIGHALLEGFDAFGDIAHHVRNLAAAAEDQQKYGADDQPVPDAQRTHENLRPPHVDDGGACLAARCRF
jgi:hypothetical protein